MPAALSTGGATIAQRVIDWQRSAGRHSLPWQQSRDPYRVWLSEIMLQQTQVATVLGYYERFLARFPDVRGLAAASLDEVLALWSGLGYYSRARNLHRCATVVVEVHGGEFPRHAAQLAELPGIGQSTAAAIAAFCFGEHVAILDGNVKRVLSRCLGFDGDLAQAAQQRVLWDAATRLLPPAGVYDNGAATGIAAYTQGLMDLGAGICSQRAPDCAACPLRADCVAAELGEPERFPLKTRRLKRSRRSSHWLSLVWRGRMWLVQRPPQGIWASLWSLSEFEDAAALDRVGAGWPGDSRALPPFKHVLTHLDWQLHPVQHLLPDALTEPELVRITGQLPDAARGRWFAHDEVASLGLPAALRKILPALQGQ
ncbi:A/G-specific adenine glycosylase [Piscinibacter sakaiensis]|uniref:A/G-specific adenine glycosylase n=1 Tax=Piscinibacter sakaiensis TaxID=1547922 RepID=UPI003AAC47F8